MKIKIIILQGILLLVVLTLIYIFYPKVDISVNGSIVKFDSIDVDVIIISENLDFSNPRYLDLSETDSIFLDLKPGTYYWKGDNGLIEGLGKKFIIESEVGLGIEREGEESDLTNVGNVRVNISKSESGVMVGHIILEPEDSEEIEDKGEYIGGQNE